MKKVFLDDLPKRKVNINWEKSVGKDIPFIYNDINGVLKIIKYISSKSRLTVLYNEKEYEIFTGHLKQCKISSIIGVITKEFKLCIGEKIKDDYRNIIIIDRIKKEKVKNKCKEIQKWYKYKCNKCGNEDWVIEYSLIKQKCGCNVCCNFPRKALLGVNTIWDTDRWMVGVGMSEEDAKKYTRASMNRVIAVCPVCNRKKDVCINTICSEKSICCECSSKGTSYPERIMISVLNQLNIRYIKEYCPKWIDKKRYDFYLKDYNCIIETHGMQHYRESMFIRTLQEEKENDRYKEQVAKENGIDKYIVIDCRKSNLDWIKNNILNSELSKLFDLSKVNWIECEKFTMIINSAHNSEQQII